MLLMESAIGGFLGSIVGIMLGLSAGAVLVRSLFAGEERDISFAVPWDWVGYAVLVGVLTGAVAGSVSAHRATKIQPMEVLSYERLGYAPGISHYNYNVAQNVQSMVSLGWIIASFGSVMEWIVANLFYWGVIIGTMILLGFAIYYLISEEAGARGVAAAIIPFVCLIFIVALNAGAEVEGTDEPPGKFLGNANKVVLFIVGIVAGVVCAQGMRRFSDEEGSASILVLIYASLLSFLLYTFIESTIDVLNLFFFGLIVSWAADSVIFGVD